jgi:predicted  nucleic acid-binding Zn-ribbon protein
MRDDIHELRRKKVEIERKIHALISESESIDSRIEALERPDRPMSAIEAYESSSLYREVQRLRRRQEELATTMDRLMHTIKRLSKEMGFGMSNIPTELTEYVQWRRAYEESSEIKEKLYKLDNDALRMFPDLGYERRLKRSRSSEEMLFL